MFTHADLLTSFCYVIETIPFHFIAYFPFRDRFRFPAWMVCCLTGFLLTIQFLVNSYLCSIGHDIRQLEFLFAAIYMIVYFLSVRAQLPKLIFIYILVLDYITIIRGIAIFLDIRFFRDAQASYELMGDMSSLALRLLILLVTAPFTFIFLNEIKDRVLKSDAPQIWNTIWLLPALTSFMVLLFTYDLDTATISGLAFLLARVCLLITTIIVYYILVASLDALRQQAEATERERNRENIMDLQRLQYARLQKQIEETRQARHDLRQHLNVIQAYLDRGETQALRDYLQKHTQKLALAASLKSYCANQTVDTVIRYYAEQAKASGISFDAQLNLPRQLSVDEPDICVLLGNLLENAVDACRLIPSGESFIRVHAQVAGTHAITITVDNSCLAQPSANGNGFLSSKHPGQGIGTLSVCNIAQQYHGLADFKCEGGVFYASVFLNP